MISPEKIRELPTKSGCYLFKNDDEMIIYIGKANNLRRRITSYFRKDNDEKRRNFIPQIEHVDILVTNNQKEALILEQNLIKKYQPRYNVLLKSNNSYPYILITNEKNPRYALVYRAYSRKGEYFGPFPEGSRAREVLNLLERVLPLARCKAKKEKKPCIYYSIGQCSGYCFKEVDKSYYNSIRKEVTDFFEGKTEKLKDRLVNLFEQSIRNLSFEVAQKQKKIIDSIDFFTTKQHVEFKDRQNYDFLGIFAKNGTFALNVLVYRYGKLVLSSGKVFSLKEQLADEDEIIQSYIFQFYKQNLPPSVLYSQEELSGREIFEEEFSLKNLVPTTEKAKKIMKIAELNAEERWNRSLLNNFRDTTQLKTLEEIASIFKIPTPFNIEALDISNIFLSDAVASFSVFTNGEYKNSKLYKLAPERSDPDYMRVACRKHYNEVEQSRAPDLIVIDGAREQIKAVLGVLGEININSKVIGLVKNSKHQTEKMMNDNFEEIEFTSREVRDFFTQTQEIVHNKAIAFHRKLHGKNALKVSKILPEESPGN